jgi:hypothetical protein
MDLKLYHKIVSCILRFEGFVRNASRANRLKVKHSVSSLNISYKSFKT